MTIKSFEAEIELTLRFCHQVECKSHADAEIWFDDLNSDDALILLKEKTLWATPLNPKSKYDQ